MISEEFMSEMTEHNTSDNGMNWDWGTVDICTGDRSPETHVSRLLSETGGPAAVHTNTPGLERSLPDLRCQ